MVFELMFNNSNSVLYNRMINMQKKSLSVGACFIGFERIMQYDLINLGGAAIYFRLIVIGEGFFLKTIANIAIAIK